MRFMGSWVHEVHEVEFKVQGAGSRFRARLNLNSVTAAKLTRNEEPNTEPLNPTP
jgi:hypothetical protein